MQLGCEYNLLLITIRDRNCADHQIVILPMEKARIMIWHTIEVFPIACSSILSLGYYQHRSKEEGQRPSPNPQTMVSAKFYFFGFLPSSFFLSSSFLPLSLGFGSHFFSSRPFC